MEHTLAWIGTAIGIGVGLGGAWAAFRAKGQASLVDLMEQRIRIQDEELARRDRENEVLVDRNRMLMNGFVERIVEAVERTLRDRPGSRRDDGGA